MAKFLTTHATAYYIEEIIQQTESELTLITPYLKLSRVLLDRLKDANRRGVHVRIVYGKNELQPEQHEKLAELDQLSLFFLENLHAKCYCNEAQAVIGSMNMYDFSEKTNREMGVLLSREEDVEAFEAAMREVESILAGAEDRTPASRARRDRGSDRSSHARARREGFCVRCSDPISYRPQAPLCKGCYESWAAWSNENYDEKYCHRCGEANRTTKAKPLCHDCYREEPFTPRSTLTST